MSKNLIYLSVVSIIVILFATTILYFFYYFDPNITGFVIFETLTQQQFDLGNYTNVFYNGTALVLIEGNLEGRYTSVVFDSNRTSLWRNISWIYSGTSPVFFVRSCDDPQCNGEWWQQILLNTPSNLSLSNARYFQYRIDFSRSNPLEEQAIYSVLVDYELFNIAPNLEIYHPQNGATYNYNESLPLEFSVNDEDLDSCWYSLNGGQNISLPNCNNITFSTTFGYHSINLFANDSHGVVSKIDSEFNVSDELATLYLIYPPNNHSSNTSQQGLFYFVESQQLAFCNLHMSSVSGWSLNSINETPLNGGINSFIPVVEDDGLYDWKIRCFDSQTEKTTESAERDIILDKIAPSISILSPYGTYNSKLNIPLSLDVEDASSITCVYTLTRIGDGVLLVVVMPQCTNTNFNVDKEGDYQLTVLITDSAGNSASNSTSFSVSSSGQPTSGGGGGGGISVDIKDLVVPKLGHGKLDYILIRPGHKSDANFELINKGNKFLNNCSIYGTGSFVEWVKPTFVGSLSPGQKLNIQFEISTPREISPGDVYVEILAKCNEISEKILFPIKIIPAEFYFKFISYNRDKVYFLFNYSLEDLTGFGSDVFVNFSLVNSFGISIYEGRENVRLNPWEIVIKNVKFELPKDSFGEFSLIIQISTKNDSLKIVEPVFLSSFGVTGFVISDNNKRALSIFGIIIVISLIVFFVFKYVKKRSENSVNKI